MSSQTSASPRVFVARQPILDRTGRVYGYELLHRDPSGGAARRAVADDRATARILTDGVLAIGFEALTGGRHAVINVSRQFLLDGVPAGLPAQSVILGIGADIEADSTVVTACEALRQAGYGLALDSYLLVAAHAEMLALATHLRVDFADVADPAERRPLLAAAPPGARLIATHVETPARFQEAVAEGFHYFQGSFFGRPAVKEGRNVPAHQLAQLRLLRALNDPNLSVHQLADLIKPDPSMCYRVLRAVNSARFALQTTVSSIPEALVLLGRDTIRRWVSLWSLASLGDTANGVLLQAASLRGRFCEVLADQGGHDDAEGFLLGLCSMLDAILEQPLAAVIEDLPLTPAMKAALVGEDNFQSRLLRCAIAWEQGEWDQAIELAEAAGLDPAVLPGAYASALQWASELDRLASDSAA